MSNTPIQERVNLFCDIWIEECHKPTYAPHYRLKIRDSINRLLNRIGNKWYNSNEVIDFADELESEISESLTPRLKAVASDDLENLPSQLSDAVSQDTTNSFETGEVKQILENNIDNKSIEKELSNTDFDWHNIKSALYQEISKIDLRESKKSLEFFDQTEYLESCVTELESETFQERYREELASSCVDFIKHGPYADVIDNIVGELIGELHSTGWDDDSIEDVIENLESEDDINSFFKILCGERYERTYCVPLPANPIPDGHMNMAGVDFYSQESEGFDFIDDMISKDERAEPFIELLGKDTDLYAVLSVTAPTQEKGEYLMEKKLERAIDALNFAKKRGVIQSPFMQPQTRYICKVEGDTYNMKADNHPKYAFPYDWNTDEENLESRKEWFQFLESSQRESTELEQRFLRSYRWYGDAVQSGIPEEELLKYMISMENMLIPETYGKKRDLLAERLANIREIYEKYRQGFKDTVAGLYDTRNELVHSAKIDVPDLEGDVERARRLSSRMFAIIAEEYLDEFDRTEELLESLEGRPVPEEPEDANPFVVG